MIQHGFDFCVTSLRDGAQREKEKEHESAAVV